MCGICGFANCRNDELLEGIDLSTGSQPISNEDGAVTTTR